MPKRIRKLSEMHSKMMFDLVYEGMSDEDVAEKYNISESKLSSIKNSKLWKAEERKLWDEMIAALIYRRKINTVSA
tara:strand:+ start:1508 stop:1735 length:228 start_codon:yes stop_codon:yes gene_type:complete